MPASIAEVEVDDETGDVTVLKMKSAYEIGRALNPKLVEQQLVGGSWMGMSHALYETTEPYYPDRAMAPRDFNEYLMPGPGDSARHDILVLERPAPDGPFGAKGPGEMCANPLLPAVANAVFDAVGVRIDDAADHAGKDPAGAEGARRRSARGDARGKRAWRCAVPSPASAARASSRTRCAPPITSPTRACDRRLSSRSRWASRCCWKARRASARPKRPRRSPASSAAS